MVHFLSRNREKWVQWWTVATTSGCCWNHRISTVLTIEFHQVMTIQLGKNPNSETSCCLSIMSCLLNRWACTTLKEDLRSWHICQEIRRAQQPMGKKLWVLDNSRHHLRMTSSWGPNFLTRTQSCSNLSQMSYSITRRTNLTPAMITAMRNVTSPSFTAHREVLIPSY